MLIKRSLFFAVLLYATPIFSQQIFHQPPRFTVAGVPVRIEASLDNAKDFLWARLYVRRAFEARYQVIQMNGSGRRFQAEIPANMMVEQGTRYYIQVRLQNQTLVRSPSGAPASTHLLRNREAAAQFHIAFLKPEQGSEVGEQAEMLASVRGLQLLDHSKKVRLLLDGEEVVPEIEFGFVKYQPVTKLPQGPHAYLLQILDQNGKVIAKRKLDFIVKPEFTPEEQIRIKEQDKAETDQQKKVEKFKTSGSFSATYQYAETQSQGSTNLPNPDGYYTIQGQYKAEKKDTKYFLGPAQFTNQKAEGGNRVQQFTFGMKRKQFETQWGTISTDMTDFTSGGVSMLGGEILWNDLPDQKKRGYKAKAFAGQTHKPVEQVSDPNNLGVYAQTAVGGQVAYAPFDKWGFFSVQAIHVKDDKSSIETAGFIPLTQSTAASISGSIFPPKVSTLKQIDFEYGLTDTRIESQSLSDTGELLNNVDDATGQGVKAKADGNLKFLKTSYSFNFQRLDPRFLYGGDNMTIGGNLSHSLFKGNLTISEGVSHSTDNLEGQKTTTLIQNNANLSIGIKAGKWDFQIKDNVDEQRNEGDPSQFLRQVNNALDTSVGYSFKISIIDFKIGTAFNQTDTIDLSEPRLSDDQRSQSVSPSLRFDMAPFKWWSLNGGAGYTYNRNQNLGNGDVTEVHNPQGDINSEMKFFTGKLIFNTGYSLNISNTVTVNETTVTLSTVENHKATGKLDWQLVKWLKAANDFSFERSRNLTQDIAQINVTIGNTLVNNATLSFDFWAGKFTMPLGFQYTRTFDEKSPSENSTENFGYTAGVKAIPRKDHSLSADFSFIQFRDYVTAAQSYDQYAVTMNYTITL